MKSYLLLWEFCKHRAPVGTKACYHQSIEASSIEHEVHDLWVSNGVSE